MKSDLNVDCLLSFKILLDDELEELNVKTKQLKEKIKSLCEISFKAGFRAGQLPENNIKYARISQ